jgi:hypothetical protein
MSASEPTKSTREWLRTSAIINAKLSAFVRSRAGNSRAKRRSAIERASVRNVNSVSNFHEVTK